MMRRYLGESERAQHDALGPRGRRGWLLGRIAIKDAVRMHRWERGDGALFPVEVEVRNEASGRPVIEGGPQISVAHKDDVAVAIVGERAVGIDIERIEPRTETFAAIAFTDAERALGAGDEWLTRVWAAKEAAAKQRGTGLTDPKQFEVVARDGDRVRIGDVDIRTRRDGDYIIAWTS
jgi:phosphopantetheinyl transferase (holo-ACP synthase)